MRRARLAPHHGQSSEVSDGHPGGSRFVPPGGSRKHVCCTPETPDVCPTASNLKHIMQIGIWTEGTAGDFHLEIKSIGAGLARASDETVLASF